MLQCSSSVAPVLLQCCSALEPQLYQNSPRVLLRQTEQVALGAVRAHVQGEALHSLALLVFDAISMETEAQRQVVLDAVLGTEVVLDTPKRLRNGCERAPVPRVLLHETCEHFENQEHHVGVVAAPVAKVLAQNASPSRRLGGHPWSHCLTSAVVTSTRNIGHTACSRSLRCHRRVESLQPTDVVLEEEILHWVAVRVVVSVARNTFLWIFGAARRTTNGATQNSVTFPGSGKWHCPARRPGPRG